MQATQESSPKKMGGWSAEARPDASQHTRFIGCMARTGFTTDSN
jgi:hypothetical protein